jgi:hypothetical protein
MADNTILNLGSGGDTIATDDISGVKYQRVKLIHGADGVNDGDVSETNPYPVTLQHTHQAYRMFVPNQAVGANKVYFDLFNATGSGKIMKVKSVRPVKNGSVAVTGALSVQLFMTRTTSVGTGGTTNTIDGTSLTALTICEFDLSNAALPAQVTARLTPTGGATAGAIVGERHIFPEETNGATYEAQDFMFDIGVDTQDFIVRENTGIRVVQGTVASVGNIGFDVIFELE